MRRYRAIEWVVAATTVVVAVGALLAFQGVQKSPVPVTVTSFNEGFEDSKRDDCEQGFQLACQWLEMNHR